MEDSNELLRCIISPRVTQSQFKPNNTMWMSHDLVIELKCSTLLIIFLIIFFFFWCSYSCHIITVASVLAWITLLKTRRDRLLLYHLQNMAFLAAALEKGCKICRPKPKKKTDTGCSLRGVLQLCLLIQTAGFTSATTTLLRWSHLQQAETDPGGHVWTGAPPPPGEVSRSFWTRNTPQAAVWLSSLISTWVTCSPAASVGLYCGVQPLHTSLCFFSKQV